MQEVERQLFQSCCDAMPLGVCLVDIQGKIIYWNAAAEGITGYLSHEVLGRAYRGDLLIQCARCGDDKKATELQCPVREVLRDGRSVVAELFLRHKEGHRVPVHVDAFPLRNPGGEMRGVAEILYPSQGKPDLAGWTGHSEREFETATGLPSVEESSGLQTGQVSQVRGFADQQPRTKLSPDDPANRRISVIVQYMDKAAPEDGAGKGIPGEDGKDSASKSPGAERK